MSIEFTDVAEEMRLEAAVWIIANNGCGVGDESRAETDKVYCMGAAGRFKMIGCPLLGYCEGKRDNSVEAGKTFLCEHFRWHSQSKAEAAKEQGQTDGPVKSCGNCRHAEDIGSNARRVVMCERIGRRHPVSFTGYPDLEPRTSEKSAPEVISAFADKGAEAAKSAINEKLASSFMCYPGGMAECIEQVKKMDKHLVTERIAQLEKENSELQSTNTRLREELAWQFEQMMEKVGTLQGQNAQLRKKLDAATKEKDSASSRLIEQLKQMGQRIKDLEREAGERSWPPRPRFFL